MLYRVDIASFTVRNPTLNVVCSLQAALDNSAVTLFVLDKYRSEFDDR